MYLLLFGIVLLILVLIPGIGREVNGSMRWINFGFFNIQGSEYVKIFIIVYLAGYLVRHEEGLKTTLNGFIKPVIVVTFVAGLLLLEPDYGAAAVLFATALGMLFVGGVPLSRFFAWVFTAVTALFCLAIISPYRLTRLTSFLNPWEDPYNRGFQLTQALIAFGRGEWTGTGLGSSVQKLFYLPEAHTDFLFAILSEELGFIGVCIVVALYALLFVRAFRIGLLAERCGNRFAAYMAYGIGMWLLMQACINMGVNMGLLPTKGLTLPLMSYGGSSLVVCCMAIGLLLRIHCECGEFSKQAVGRRKPVLARGSA